MREGTCYCCGYMVQVIMRSTSGILVNCKLYDVGIGEEIDFSVDILVVKLIFNMLFFTNT